MSFTDFSAFSRWAAAALTQTATALTQTAAALMQTAGTLMQKAAKFRGSWELGKVSQQNADRWRFLVPNRFEIWSFLLDGELYLILPSLPNIESPHNCSLRKSLNDLSQVIDSIEDGLNTGAKQLRWYA